MMFRVLNTRKMASNRICAPFKKACTSNGKFRRFVATANLFSTNSSDFSAKKSRLNPKRQINVKNFQNESVYIPDFSNETINEEKFAKTPPAAWATKDKDNFRRIEEEDEDEESTVFTPFVHKRSPIYYRDLCKRLAAEGKLAEAVAVVEKRMVEDRVRPEKFNYITVIHLLARACQARKAMEFFCKARHAGYQPGPNTITSLMNACAKAPKEDRDFALEQTKWLFNREKHEFQKIKTPAIYFAAMKCFARHGDTEAVFRMADEMFKDGWYPGARIFTYLLSAAVTDKECGFALALQIFDVMKSLKKKPDLQHYHNFLRACTECGIGKIGNRMLQKLAAENKDKQDMIDDSKDAQNLISQNLDSEQKCDLIAKVSGGNIVENDGINSYIIDKSLGQRRNEVPHTIVPETGIKFSLIGGFEALVSDFKKNDVQPDVKTCSILTHLLSNDKKWDQILLKFAEDNQIMLDTEFFNCLAYRRAMRHDSLLVLDCLDELKTRNLQPDLRTFGALAMVCKFRPQGLTLLRDMDVLNLVPNQHVFRVLLQQAFYLSRPDLEYAKNVLKFMTNKNLKPDKETISVIEDCLAELRTILINDKTVSFDDIRRGRVSYREFMEFYEQWLKNTPLLVPKDPKLTMLDKVVNTDDAREDWEKPWVKDAEKSCEESDLLDAEFEAVS